MAQKEGILGRNLDKPPVGTCQCVPLEKLCGFKKNSPSNQLFHIIQLNQYHTLSYM